MRQDAHTNSQLRHEPLPSAKGAHPSPPCYVHGGVGLVLIVGVAGRVGLRPAVLAGTPDLLDTVGDGEIVSSTEQYIDKIERQRKEENVPVLIHVVLVDVPQMPLEVIGPQETCPTKKRSCEKR
jgi:hypothetical protein